MTLVGLIAFVVLIALLVYLAQNLPPPWPMVCYALAVLFVVIALVLLLGLDAPLRIRGGASLTMLLTAIRYV